MVVSIFLFFFVIVFFVVWGRVSCRAVESSFIWVRLCVRELVVGGSVFGEIRRLEEFREYLNIGFCGYTFAFFSGRYRGVGWCSEFVFEFLRSC